MVAGDVYYRPATDDLVRVERVDFAPGAVREVQHRGKCRVVCDLAADVVRFSDGASLTVAGCSRGSRAAGWRTLTAWCGR